LTTNPDENDPSTTAKVSPKPSGGTRGGCFGNGPGRLDIPETTGYFVPDFSLMAYNSKCNITVIMVEGSRTGRNTMLITIIKGKPPLITIM
jgi:hypothetical protein